MMPNLKRLALPLLRLLSLLVLASLGTVLLVRCAPGYFSSAQEMDAEHGTGARTGIQAQQDREGTPLQAWLHLSRGLLHGDPGRSHQYDLPVSTLLLPRLQVTGRLLLPVVVIAPLLALLFALPCSQMRAPLLERAVAAATLLGIAVPLSVLASVCLLRGSGGPAVVLLSVVAARDFRFFTRLLRRQSQAPYLLYARAAGMPPLRAVLQGVLRPLQGELLSLVALSFVTALGGLLPVEVIFGVPGVGQMAWNAAMNRDLPVLLAVTLLMALGMGLANLLANRTVLQTGAVTA
ncbi:MAG: ABC transporter permease subunit [Janthinobacterium lividum]